MRKRIEQLFSEGKSGTPRTSKLAMASFVLSLASLLGLGPLGFIPGIFFGHMATTAFRRDRGLEGMRYAKAGLIIGYSLLSLAIFILGVAWGVVHLNQRNRAALTLLQPVSARPELATRKPQAAPASSLRRPDRAGSGIPPDRASGKVHGQEFHCEEAIWQEGVLTMTDGNPSPAGTKIKIFLFPIEGESADGKTYDIVPASASNVPHVHLSWIEESSRQKADFPGGYRMRLELGRITNGFIAGQIDLRVPGSPETGVKGGFAAQVK